MDIEGDIILRDMESADSQLLEKTFMHINHSTYTSYYEEMLSGESELIIALYNGELAGYAKLDWENEELEEENIPVIKELHVIEGYRNKGIASRLMDELEKRAATKSQYCAIGVGLSETYEAAQHLLAKRGYEPDGRGVFYIEPGLVHDELEVYDNQALMMIKQLDEITVSHR